MKVDYNFRNLRLKVAVKLFFAILLLVALTMVSHAELKVFAHPQVLQGKSFLVYIYNTNEVSSADVLFNGKHYKFYPCENGYRAIVPVMPEQKAGVYPVIIKASLQNNHKEDYQTQIIIDNNHFEKVSFWVKPSKKKLFKKSTIADDWAVLEKKIAEETPNKLWDGYFQKPVPGITTLSYGAKELINGKISGRHRGWDFRAKIGTKVLAPNAGTVIYSGYLNSFGGTILVDHGQGINTLYFHLSKMIANVGQHVQKGELLGLTGNSGISSGPHLHWGMSVHNVRVDPKQFVITVMP